MSPRYSRAWPLLGVCATFCFRAAWAQTTHVITVGAAGSFFDPPYVSAQVNDTISFSFLAATHAVIQSSFNNPCYPLSGGFSSGEVSRTNDSVPPSIWNLMVTNASQSIWFYCGNSQPTSHCTSGMVGAINPPSSQIFHQFVASAKKVTDPRDFDGVVLSGQGAHAAQAPAPNTTSSSIATTATASTAPPTESTAAAAAVGSSQSRKAAAVGGSLGAIFALFLLVCIASFYWQHHRRRQAAVRGSDEFFRYKARPLDFTKYTNTKTRSSSNNDNGNKKNRITFIPSKMIAPPLERFRQFTTRIAPGSGSHMTTLAEAPRSPSPVFHKLQQQPRSAIPSSIALPPLAIYDIPPAQGTRPPSPPPKAPPYTMNAAPTDDDMPGPQPSNDTSESPSGSKRVLPSRPDIHSPTITAPQTSSHQTAAVGRNASTKSVRALPRLPSPPPMLPVSSPSSPSTSARPPLPQLPNASSHPEKQTAPGSAPALPPPAQVESPMIYDVIAAARTHGLPSGRTETPPPKYGSHGSGTSV